LENDQEYLKHFSCDDTIVAPKKHSDGEFDKATGNHGNTFGTLELHSELEQNSTTAPTLQFDDDCDEGKDKHDDNIFEFG
jgi:hypothetical protein